MVSPSSPAVAPPADSLYRSRGAVLVPGSGGSWFAGTVVVVVEERACSLRGQVTGGHAACPPVVSQAGVESDYSPVNWASRSAALSIVMTSVPRVTSLGGVTPSSMNLDRPVDHRLDTAVRRGQPVVADEGHLRQVHALGLSRDDAGLGHEIVLTDADVDLQVCLKHRLGTPDRPLAQPIGIELRDDLDIGVPGHTFTQTVAALQGSRGTLEATDLTDVAGVQTLVRAPLCDVLAGLPALSWTPGAASRRRPPGCSRRWGASRPRRRPLRAARHRGPGRRAQRRQALPRHSPKPRRDEGWLGLGRR